MNSDNLILRQTTFSPLVNKNDFIDSSEFDANFTNIYEDLVAICVTSGVLNFDVNTEYDDAVNQFAMHDGRLYRFIFATPTSNVTPGTESSEAYWLEIFPTDLAHRKNSDTILAEGTASQVTASEIRAFIDAGLTSTTNLSITEHTSTSFKLNSSTGADVVIPQATPTEAGLLNSEDKVKLQQLSGENSGDQTLGSLGAEAVSNKVDNLDSPSATTYPTTNAVSTALSSTKSDIVGAAPSNLNTLEELSNAIGNDPDFADSVTTQLGGKEASLPSMVGNALKILRVNAGETAKEWVPFTVPSGVCGIPDSSGTYTFYATLSLAITAASSGQTIEVFADITETGAVQLNLKNGVNINFNGHTYTLNNAGTSDCISDNNTAVSCKLMNGRVIRTGGTISETNSCTLYIDSTTTVLECIGMKFESTFGYACINEGTVYGGEYLGLTGFYCRSGIAYNIIGRGTTSRGLRNLATIINGIGISTSSDGIYSSGQMVNCNGYSSGGYGAYIEGGSCRNCSFYSSSSFGLGDFATTYFLNCSAYSSASAAWFSQSSSSYDNCSAYSTASYGFYMTSGGNLKNCNGTSTANNGIRAINSGVKILGGVYQSTAAASVYTYGKIYGAVIICTWNNASGHCVTGASTSYSEVFNCTLEVTNASANCLHYGSAINVKFGANVFKGASTSVNANITQTQANAPDTYGNIVIG
jgi:hypothetical protein